MAPPLHEPTGDKPAEIRALFERCEQRQKAVSIFAFDKMRESFIQEMSFGPPQFNRRPAAEDAPEDAWSGQLYQTLIKRLKDAGDDDEFWRRLTLWLKAEGIREPQDFLPEDKYRKLTKNSRELLAAGFSPADYYNSYLVRIWLPYIEPLLRKAQWLRQQNTPPEVKRVLLNLGYNPELLKVLERPSPSGNWRSAVEFTCAWVAEKGGSGDTETLRNSYSRALGQRLWEGVICSFCEKPARKEFWAYGESVPHCTDHAADRLPTSEEFALPDRNERCWWRDDLDIRRKPIPLV
jgi:hypothetical protein